MDNRFDVVVIDKKTACPVDGRIRLKEHEKEEKYIDLAFEIKRLWRLWYSKNYHYCDRRSKYFL